jgi:hypothetical protein
MAMAYSMAVPILLVIRLPSTSTLFSHSLGSASMLTMDVYVVAFLSCTTVPAHFASQNTSHTFTIRAARSLWSLMELP